MKVFDAFEFSLFAMIGILNTVVDFAIFNALTGRPIRMRRIPANLISTSVGICFSFVMNGHILFAASQASLSRQILCFLAVNMISMYGIQTGVIWLASHYCSRPVQWVAEIVVYRPLRAKISSDILTKNMCKGLATLASLCFNYCCYKIWVFS